MFRTLIALILAGAGLLPAHAQTVAPHVGSWDYGENRCVQDQWGYPSAHAAVLGGAQRHYEMGCGTSIANEGVFPTVQNPQPRAVCGGSFSWDPETDHGIENYNTKWATIEYGFGSQCENTSSDGLAVMMRRPVACPEGYQWVDGTTPECIRVGIDPGKLCHDNCAAGSNPSNPVQTALGTKLQRELDFEAGDGLRFVRYYSSYRNWTSSTLGSRWRHSFEASLSIEPSPLGSYSTVWAQRPRGDRYWFNVTSAGTITNDPDIGLELKRLVDGSGNVAGWTLRDSTDAVEHYNANGVLLNIYLDGSRSIAFTYAAGKLESVQDARGRAIAFTYDVDGKLQTVADPAGKIYSYSYDDEDNLIEVLQPDATPGTSADNPKRIYHYELTEDPFLHALTGITDESSGRFASWDYEQFYAPWAGISLPRAVLSVHGPLSGTIDRTEFSYSGDGTYGTTQITDANGQSVTYEFETVLGARKLSLASAPCQGCGSLPASVTYDLLGLAAIQTDFGGFALSREREARGLVTESQEGGSIDSPAHCPAGSNYYSDPYGSGCTGGSCWAAQPFPGSLDGTPLGYPGEWYSCLIPASVSHSRTTQTDWHTTFRKPTERRTYDAANTLVAKSTWTYNTRGQGLTATQTDPVTAAVRTGTTSYCEAGDITAGTCPLLGLVKSVNGPRTDVTDTATYTYYAADDATCVSSPTTCPHRKGDLWKVTDALGRITETLAYDGAGRVLSVKDANSIITDLVYHPRGWLTARKVRGTNHLVETDDQITQIEYWPTGLVKKVTQPDGAFTAYTYDAAHRLTDIADNAGNTIHYTLDNAGNRTAEDTKDSGSTLRRTLSRVYNQLGQLQTAKDAYNHATGFTYDANGNNQTVTDALSRITDNDYDPLNRLARTLQDVGGIAAETKFEYDAQDNLTQVTDPKGLDTTYQYNGFGDLTQLASPDTGTTTYTYDSAGNRKTQTDARGIVSTYSYDALNRLTGIAYPTSSLNVGYLYDTANPVCTTGETFAIGRLTQMTDSSGDTRYCYDRFGNLTRKVQTTNAKVFTLRYAYTLAGQLQAITYPDGAIVDYVRDGQGRITEVGATPAGGVRAVLLNQATYHPFGPVAGWVYGNGRTMSRPLNQNYQPTAVADNASGGLSLGYEFDAVGNLSKLYNADQSVTKAQYGYDALNRLADVKDGPTGTVIEHYGYDATGNRISFTNAGGTTGYTYSGTNHRLTQVGATARTYDNAGNTTQIGGTAKEFVYNDAGRMSQVKVSGATAMNYQLNGRGEQVRKYLNMANTYTVYDEAGRWVGDYDSAGAAIQQAVWLDDLPVGLLASSQLKYLQPDHLGTPRSVVDPTSNVGIWHWELEGEAFGDTTPNQDPDGNGAAFMLNMRLPGQRYDIATGLNYNYFRDYSPADGRYVQSDPIGLRGGSSSYGYVDNDPLGYFDPQGLVKWTGRLAVGYATFTPKYKKIPIKKFEYARITIELKSECVGGERTTVALIGKVDVTTNNPILKMQLGYYDVELRDNLSTPNPEALAGHVSVNSTGYWSASGFVAAGIASGSIEGKSVAELTVSGTTEVAPFSVTKERCACE